MGITSLTGVDTVVEEPTEHETYAIMIESEREEK